MKGASYNEEQREFLKSVIKKIGFIGNNECKKLLELLISKFRYLERKNMILESISDIDLSLNVYKEFLELLTEYIDYNKYDVCKEFLGLLSKYVDFDNDNYTKFLEFLFSNHYGVDKVDDNKEFMELLTENVNLTPDGYMKFQELLPENIHFSLDDHSKFLELLMIHIHFSPENYTFLLKFLMEKGALSLDNKESFLELLKKLTNISQDICELFLEDTGVNSEEKKSMIDRLGDFRTLGDIYHIKKLNKAFILNVIPRFVIDEYAALFPHTFGNYFLCSNSLFEISEDDGWVLHDSDILYYMMIIQPIEGCIISNLMFRNLRYPILTSIFTTLYHNRPSYGMQKTLDDFINTLLLSVGYDFFINLKNVGSFDFVFLQNERYSVEQVVLNFFDGNLVKPKHFCSLFAGAMKSLVAIRLHGDEYSFESFRYIFYKLMILHEYNICDFYTQEDYQSHPDGGLLSLESSDGRRIGDYKGAVALIETLLREAPRIVDWLADYEGPIYTVYELINYFPKADKFPSLCVSVGDIEWFKQMCVMIPFETLNKTKRDMLIKQIIMFDNEEAMRYIITAQIQSDQKSFIDIYSYLLMDDVMCYISDSMYDNFFSRTKEERNGVIEDLNLALKTFDARYNIIDLVSNKDGKLRSVKAERRHRIEELIAREQERN